MNEPQREPLVGTGIWHWPEFIAFWDRLGMPRPAIDYLELRLAQDECPVIVYDRPKWACDTLMDRCGLFASAHASQDVFHWPEFKALIARMGVVLPSLITAISIKTDHEAAVSVKIEYICEDMGSQP